MNWDLLSDLSDCTHIQIHKRKIRGCTHIKDYFSPRINNQRMSISLAAILMKAALGCSDNAAVAIASALTSKEGK
jgi:hypothetical protein